MRRVIRVPEKNRYENDFYFSILLSSLPNYLQPYKFIFPKITHTVMEKSTTCIVSVYARNMNIKFIFKRRLMRVLYSGR